MTNDRVEKRRAYEVANASHRRYEARFAASGVLGAVAVEVFDENARIELERLAAAKAEAYNAWQLSLRS
ncbi:MAG: hypothetical protein EXR66_00970 [Dehalococcoidia bacterium]|nr:hypothetical protein [Dehalococcoidia bacterium]